MPPSTSRPCAIAATAVAALLLPALVAAQDAHYWSYGYGPIGQLTEGTLVGGVSDLSAVYYNPGALALIDEPRFVLGLTSVQLSHIEVPGAAGAGLDFDSQVFDVVPSIVAGHLGRNDGQRDHFAYAFLSRHDTDWDLGYNNVSVSSQPGGSAGFGRLRERVVEYWVGGTWSHRLRPGLSLGISPFLAYRAQRSRRTLTLEQVASGASSAAFVARENEYNHARALARLGIAWRPGSWQLGLTATTPGVRLYDSGKSVFNATVAGQGLPPLLSASTQKGLHADYHSPWSVGGGASWRRGGTALHSTAEWFSSVDPYDILEPAPAPIAGSEATIPLTFVGAADSVFNYGVGLEQRLNERLTLYAGAARNASTWNSSAETLASWDLTEATAGFSLLTSRARVAFGAGYSWGHGEIPRVIASPFQEAPPETPRASFSRWTFSIGASTKGK